MQDSTLFNIIREESQLLASYSLLVEHRSEISPPHLHSVGTPPQTQGTAFRVVEGTPPQTSGSAHIPPTKHRGESHILSIQWDITCNKMQKN
jgi:hypothetical protein